MNFRTIVRYLGILLSIMGALIMVPLLVSAAEKEFVTAGIFFFVMVLCVVIGGSIILSTENVQKQLSSRDAMVLVVGAWVMASLVGAIPYLLSGALPNFVDAFFESVSGFTTTGSSVFTHIADQSRGILFWRSYTQWIGGLGLITLFVSLFPLFGLGAARLLEAEAPAGQEGERLTARLQDSVRILFIIYFALTFAQILLLLLSGLSLFDSTTISFSSLSTGGFAPTNLSIEDYHNHAAEIITMIFMFLGGTNFALFYWLLFRRQLKRFINNPELRLYTGIVIGTIILVNFDLIFNMGLSLGQALWQSSFNVASIATTTGFSTTNFDAWPHFSRSILLVLMVIGASAGSTGGGLKVIRVLILFKYAYRRILLAINPSAVIPLKIGNTVLPEKTISRTIGLTVFYIGLLWGGFVLMSALGMPFEEAISSVAACMASVGPGLGSVGPYGNYADVPTLGKIALSFFMIAGRLEIFAFLVIFTPAFWRRT
jgi:trk system potassium uptake protein